jgi:hypothetical protein
LEGGVAPAKTPRPKAAHLMCGLPFWGFAAFLGCAYLSYLSVVHVRRAEFDWPHDAWSIAGYGVWVLLMAGLMNETRCRRERTLFALVLANFLLGFVLAVWSNAPEHAVRQMRLASAGMWGLAAVAGLTVMFSAGKQPTSGKGD